MTAPFQAFGELRRLARRPPAGERCELCGAAVAPDHDHLMALEKRRLTCACRPCAILFAAQAEQRYKRVPARILSFPHFRLSDAQWDSLLIPINMAFFCRNSLSGQVTAVYPSPAGATESLLELEAWRQIAAENPALASMEPDVEALLVNRLGPARGYPQPRYFLLPIDRCFQLVGLVRTHWRGLSGGEELWRALGQYFADLDARACVMGAEQHA